MVLEAADQGESGCVIINRGGREGAVVGRGGAEGQHCRSAGESVLIGG